MTRDGHPRRSSALTRAVSIVVCLVCLPVGWVLHTTASTRMEIGWYTNTAVLLHAPVVLLLLGGTALLLVPLLTLHWSSAGLLISGALLFLPGLLYVLAPGLLSAFTVSVRSAQAGGFWDATLFDLRELLNSGWAFTAGLGLMCLGLVGVAMRRQRPRPTTAPAW